MAAPASAQGCDPGGTPSRSATKAASLYNPRITEKHRAIPQRWECTASRKCQQQTMAGCSAEAPRKQNSSVPGLQKSRLPACHVPPGARWQDTDSGRSFLSGSGAPARWRQPIKSVQSEMDTPAA